MLLTDRWLSLKRKKSGRKWESLSKCWFSGKMPTEKRITFMNNSTEVVKKIVCMRKHWLFGQQLTKLFNLTENGPNCSKTEASRKTIWEQNKLEKEGMMTEGEGGNGIRIRMK